MNTNIRERQIIFAVPFYIWYNIYKYFSGLDNAMNILYINACVRVNSRTARLAAYYIKRRGHKVKETALISERMTVMDEGRLNEREEALKKSDTENELLKFAAEFSRADEIIIAAPYWDLSFPSKLKTYIENICVPGVTFDYTDDGFPRGLCRAKRLIYVTTAGGRGLPYDFGYGYIKALCGAYFGIDETRLICAEGLDIVGADEDAILEAARRDIDGLIADIERTEGRA